MQHSLLLRVDSPSPLNYSSVTFLQQQVSVVNGILKSLATPLIEWCSHLTHLAALSITPAGWRPSQLSIGSFEPFLKRQIINAHVSKYVKFTSQHNVGSFK